MIHIFWRPNYMTIPKSVFWKFLHYPYYFSILDGVYFLHFYQRIQVSSGLGCNAKIFKKHFLELSYNLVFKKYVSHLWAIYFFRKPFRATVYCLFIVFLKSIFHCKAFHIFVGGLIMRNNSCLSFFLLIKPSNFMLALEVYHRRD